MSRHKGYTVIELLIVIVVISIIAVGVSARFASVDSYRAEGFSDVFLADIRLTSVLSVSENKSYRMIVGANAYQIQDENGTSYINQASGTDIITYPSGVSITPQTTIIFDSLGRPYDSNSVLLSSQLDFVVSAGTTENTVSVSPQTGFVQ